MTTDTKPLTVEQIDRDAAVLYAVEAGWGSGSCFALAGHADMEDDELRLVQAFARHRLAALAASPVGEVAYSERLEYEERILEIEIRCSQLSSQLFEAKAKLAEYAETLGKTGVYHPGDYA